MVEIRQVRKKEDAEAVYVLAYEFIAWLRDRYPDMSDDITNYMKHQKFDEQIRDVLIHYNPPKGECLLALRDDEPVGILMLKDIGAQACEMNRMFVRESGRGLGIGRALVDRLIERAVEMGFSTMELGALPRHHEAIALYRSMGFEFDDRPRGQGNSSQSVLMKLDLSPYRG